MVQWLRTLAVLVDNLSLGCPTTACNSALGIQYSLLALAGMGPPPPTPHIPTLKTNKSLQNNNDNNRLIKVG